ncbi:hypothetical protein HZS_6953 [Henneguya salminicola]|nr:hypothetical protein HZS_6953 [Henneguya salminicola]
MNGTEVHRHLNRQYGYSSIYSKTYFPVPGNRVTKMSDLVAISKGGMVRFTIRTGSFNSDGFIIFIREQRTPYLLKNPVKLLVIENARFHHSQAVKSLHNKNKIAFKYHTDCSSQLNPIEEFFSMIKARYVAQKDNFTTIPECLAHVFNENFRNVCANFCINMLT